MHAMTAFVAAGRSASAKALLDAQNQAAERDDDNAGYTLDVGQAATRAIKAFAEGRYEQAVQLLRPVRGVAHRFGGSHAQRDVIDRALIEAARRAGMTRLFGALMHERASARGDSPTALNDGFLARPWRLTETDVGRDGWTCTAAPVHGLQRSAGLRARTAPEGTYCRLLSACFALFRPA